MRTLSLDVPDLAPGGADGDRSWTRNRLLAGLRPQQLAGVEELLFALSVDDGEIIAREGDVADGVLLVLEGALVSLRDGRSEIGRHEAGDYVGFDESLAGRPRHATLQALGPGRVALLPRPALLGLRLSDPFLLSALVAQHQEALAVHLAEIADRVASGDQARAEEHQDRERLGMALLSAVGGLFVYNSLRLVVPETAGGSSVAISSLFVLGFALACVAFVRLQPFPLRIYGLHTERLGPSLRLALGGSAAFLLALLAAKAAFIHLPGSPWAGRSPIELRLEPSIDLLVYALFVPLQEFVARGTLQGILGRLLVGRWAAPAALLTANCLFSLAHLHLGLAFAISSFVPGLLWGWVFLRTGSLPAVIVSHLAVGFVIVNVLLPEL